MPVSRFWPRFTIERLRTLVLIGGGLLVIAIAVFLVGGQWKRRFLTKDIPRRLGIDIQQQADGVNYTQTRKGKTLFKLHAARSEQMKQDGKYLLHDVKIDLYGDDGNRTDTISGGEFEYEPTAGMAHAAGPVEITLMRPGVKPAIAQLKPGAVKQQPVKPPEIKQPPVASPASTPPANQVADSEIHVKTSGLFFNQKTGVATTAERVDFVLRQGNGNSIGATYDSAKGHLILDHAVELHAERNTVHGDAGPVTVHATHADFERTDDLCQLTQAQAEYTGGTAQTANALIHFRPDGSVIRLDGSGGVDLKTLTGSHVTAPTGSLDFDEHNHPSHGLLQGGATLDMNQPNRQVHGTSPTARLLFDGEGQLSQAHMEQGVIFNSQQQITTAKGVSEQVRRTWKSQIADVAFAPSSPAASSKAGGKPGQKPSQQTVQQASQNHAQGSVEARTIHGYGGVVITSETNAGGVVTPSRLAADTVVAELAPGSVLSSLVGTGHAAFEQRTAEGVHQTSNSDSLDVRFAPATESSNAQISANATASAKAATGGADISSIVQIGHVVLVQDPAPPRPGHAAQAQIRATANRSDYDGQTQLLHLTGSPRVRDGALDMTADQIDFARATGDAFAHGDVRASWSDTGNQSTSSAASASAPPGSGLLAGHGGPGGNGPIHAIAAEAELHQSTEEIIFKAASPSSKTPAANLPRLWQAANSVSAPLIILNRQKQTLTAQAGGPATPVRTVLLSNPAPKSNPNTAETKTEPTKTGKKSKSSTPSVIRVRSGDLHYSEAERLALFHSGSVGSVTAETTDTGGTATVVSQDTEVRLLPAGVHANPQNARPNAASAHGTAAANSPSPATSSPNTSVDQLTATGHVTIDWPDRKGTGEKLVYLSEDGTYTLTGTAAAPPRMTDQARSTVTGSALIYHSRDDSVTVEGDGAKTVTDTRSKK